MFRSGSYSDWFTQPVDPRCGSNVLFICPDEWEKMFPHLKNRKNVTLTVHNRYVKGSKMFHISRPFRVMNFVHGIRGVEDMFGEMESRINDLLDSQGKEQMKVWVTAE